MDILVLILLALVAVGLRPMAHNNDYIGRDTTTAIKGIFAVIILYSHGRQYLPPPINNCSTDVYGILYNTLLNVIGQLMVVMFLFYSGFGIVESYKRKRGSYLRGFLSKRVLKTLLHFDMAVAAFVALALLLGHDYSFVRYLLSFTAWESVGNSNWFIFDIIVLYLIAYGGFLIVERRQWNLKRYLLIVFCASFIFLAVMLKVKGGESWWWDTILAFPTGMLWSVYRQKIEARLYNQRTYAAVTSTVALIFVGLYYLGHHCLAIFSIFTSAVFGILLVLVTMRCRIGNKALHWLGVNAFAIYILQRLPMIIASEMGLHQTPLLFMSAVIPTTLLIAWGFTRMTDCLDRKLFS